MGASLGGSGTISELNLTPLIDIVLVVLIIMMVNIPIQIEEMGVKLPGKVEVQSKPDTKSEQLVIAIYAPTEKQPDVFPLALNRKLMDKDTVFSEVTRRLRGMEKKNVFIDGHPDVPYGRLVDMMDLARQAGAEKVGLARLKDAGPLDPTDVAIGAREKGVIIGNPAVVGAITNKLADEAIQPWKGNLLACYDKALAEKSDLSGRMVIRFSVGPQGEQMSSRVSTNTLENETLTTCITELMPSIEFKPLGEQKTAIVQYPLLFSPG